MPAKHFAAAHSLMARAARTLAAKMEQQPDWVWLVAGLLLAICPVCAAYRLVLLVASAL